MLSNWRHLARALALLTLLAAVGAASAAAFPLPDGGPELGSIGRPGTYPFAMGGGGGETGIADFIAPEAGDPTTDGSGSSCADPDGGPPWTFTRTYWYAVSPIDPLLLDLHTSGTHIALAIYAVADPSAKPTAADRVACVGGPNGTDTSLELPTDPDLTYRFQLGTIGSGPVNSSWNFRAGLRAPNDEQQDAIALPLDTSVLVSNFGASEAPGEPPPDCSPWGQLGSGRSVWLRTTVATPGTLRVDLDAWDLYGTPGYLALFSPDGATMLDCELVGFRLPTTRLDAQVQPGTYLVRVSTGTPLSSGSPATWQSWWVAIAHLTPTDLDRDGYYQPADCNDGDAAIHPGAIDLPEDGIDQDCSGTDAVNFDRDGDTYARPADCNDGNAAIHPEADEVPDDGVDQNCDGHDSHRDSDGDGTPDYQDHCPRRASGGIDADRDGCRDPFQLVVVAQMTLTTVGDHLHLLQGLTVRSARGARIAVTCTRHACQRMTFTLRRTAVTLKRGFARQFPVGTEVTVAASRPGALGMVKRYRLSPSRVQVTHQWCTAEGQPAKRIACA